MRIELEDTPQAVPVTLVQTILRLVLGLACIAHGLNKLQAPGPFLAELSLLPIPRPETFAQGVLGLELLTGIALLFGRFTRSAAFLSLCDVGVGAALAWMRGVRWPVWEADAQLEALLLSLACCAFFMVVGGGPLALDAVLRRRARLRAIAKDPTWSRPPYVT
jgi:uncharacterized membrane protein YphA (DoxX/SURF4 family)